MHEIVARHVAACHRHRPSRGEIWFLGRCNRRRGDCRVGPDAGPGGRCHCSDKVERRSCPSFAGCQGLPPERIAACGSRTFSRKPRFLATWSGVVLLSRPRPGFHHRSAPDTAAVRGDGPRREHAPSQGRISHRGIHSSCSNFATSGFRPAG